MKKYLLIVMLFLFWVDVYAVNISVDTDRNPVVLNESFQLIFESDEAVDNEPDFAPLSKDFQVLSTSTSNNMSIINSRISSTKTWTLSVLARRAGNLTVPSIRFGRDRSQPYSLTVSNLSSSGNSDTGNQLVFIEVDVPSQRVYVQSQIIYKIRLFRSIVTSNASLSDPKIEGMQAVVERISDNKTYETRRNGKRYGVVEISYAIYPQVSGKIKIDSVVFQGQTSTGRSFFGPQPKTIVVLSNAIEMDVLPMPESYTGKTWLPAEELNIAEQWSENPPTFTVGEPITRTLTISAKGMIASQLPELPEWLEPTVRQYPDQPVLKDDKSEIGITASRLEKIAMIPNQTGEFILPEISIPWWNTKTDRQESISVPARRIKVASPIATTTPGFSSLSDDSLGSIDLPDTQIVSGDELLDVPQELNSQEQQSEHIWRGISLALLVSWFATIALWLRARNYVPPKQEEQESASSIRTAIKDIKLACEDNEPAKAKKALLQWGRLTWEEMPPSSIGEIAGRCSEAMAKEIQLISSILYSKHEQVWHGDIFWQVFTEERKLMENKDEVRKGKLEPLYKI